LPGDIYCRHSDIDKRFASFEHGCGQALLAAAATSRLDPIIQADTMELLVETTTESGTAVVLVTHDSAMAASRAGRQMNVVADS